MRVPQNRWFIMEKPTKMDDDWGYPHLWKPPYLKPQTPQTSNAKKNPPMPFSWPNHVGSPKRSAP